MCKYTFADGETWYSSRPRYIWSAVILSTDILSTNYIYNSKLTSMLQITHHTNKHNKLKPAAHTL
jgi:hypothetical protein